MTLGIEQRLRKRRQRAEDTRASVGPGAASKLTARALGLAVACIVARLAAARTLALGWLFDFVCGIDFLRNTASARR